jgi:uncharacterized spore protein YtfJ
VLGDPVVDALMAAGAADDGRQTMADETRPVSEPELRVVSEPIERILEHLTAAPVFGPPTTAGEVTVIPVSAVSFGFGFGAGGGRGPAGPEPAGGGSGAGGGGRAEPRGYIRVTGAEVKYEPIIDQTRVAVAGILMVAWNVFWIGVTVRAVLQRRGRRPRA